MCYNSPARDFMVSWFLAQIEIFDMIGIESHPTFRHTLDIKEFLSFTIPRQVVFFELGFDLASSNSAQTMDKLEKSLYGVMLVNTPRAFLHLLNRDLFLATFIVNIFLYPKFKEV